MFKITKSLALKLTFTALFWLLILDLATKLNFDILIASFDKIRWDIFIISTVLFIIAIYFDGYAWRYMLSHLYHEKLHVTTTTNIHTASVGMGQLIPSGGASELAARVWLMKRQFGVSSEETLGSMLLFRLFFYCTTFISTLLMIWSLYALNVIDFQLAVILLIFFYFIEFLGLIFLYLAFYRLDLINKIFLFIHRIIPLKIVDRFNNFLIEQITGISQKFDEIKNEFSNKRQITIFLGFVVIQYTLRQIAIFSIFYVLLPNITLPPIIVVTTLTTFLTSLPLIIPANQGVRELSNAVILAPYVGSSTPVEILVLVGVLQGFQIWIYGAVSVVIILYYLLFKKPFKTETKEENFTSESIDQPIAVPQHESSVDI